MKLRNKILSTFCILLMPFFGQAQHHWLMADPEVAAKKMPVRLSILSGDDFLPQAGSELPVIERFTLHLAKDSFSLKESSTGGTALVKGEIVTETFLAAARLRLPEKSLLLGNLQHQLTKEQKAILAKKDTASMQGGIAARRLHYVKTLVPVQKHKDKANLYNRQLNHDLEVLLNTDPALVKPGTQVVVQVLLHQRVLPYHKFTVWRQEEGGKIIQSETSTNKAGIRLITVPKAGKYVILVSQEGPHRIGLTDEIEWKSLEASYSFTIE